VTAQPLRYCRILHGHHEGRHGEGCAALLGRGVEEHLREAGGGFGVHLLGAAHVLGDEFGAVDLAGADERAGLQFDRGAQGRSAQRVQEDLEAAHLPVTRRAEPGVGALTLLGVALLDRSRVSVLLERASLLECGLGALLAGDAQGLVRLLEADRDRSYGWL
jgi:hypothetical protein